MAKPTGPLLSFDASGQIAKTQVYATWRGRSYVRRYVIPANPRTTGQVDTRSVFSFLQQVWKLLPTIAALPWTAAAKGNAYTNRNLYTSRNLPILRGGTDMSTWVGSPGFGGMFPPTGVAVAPTLVAGELSVTGSPPTMPPGWTLTELVAITIRNADPHLSTFHATTVVNNPTFPLAFTGLQSGFPYAVAVWASGAKPDGTIVYSASQTFVATPL